MYSPRLWLAALLAAAANAQFASYDQDGHSISVNVPSDTASGSGQSIFFQITAPSGTSWTGFGQGSRMSGANMFIVYSDGNNNVTVSPRLGTGHVMPQYNSDAQITVLGGTGIQPDGSMVANVRCDSCLSWSGGSMEATDSSSNWIWAYSGGSSLDTTSTSASIRQHSSYGAFTLDLTQGTGGSSVNPFVSAVDTSNPSSTPSSGPSTPVASSDAGSSSGSNGTSSEISDNTIGLRRTHGIVMSVTFVLLFPLAALTLYLPFAKRVLLIHAPLQVIGIILMIVGLAAGVRLGKRIDELDAYHMIIGYIVVAVLILFQPLLGLFQHIYFRRNEARSIMGVVHQSLGRLMILLGIINGGLGFNITGPVGSRYVPRGAVIAYGVIAGLVALFYVAIVIFGKRSSSRSGTSSPANREKAHNRYWQTELQPRGNGASPERQHWQPHGQSHGRPTRTNSNRYTISGRGDGRP
ncbi:uncharacterized protein HMPREF1541_01788 [Cyphellophora europaea CBS 101466]|uniref:DOMON domain-containing protein n=1 Tax=Cyphellophora europaea (strain CBS 101466) TaxID=1220924 RepID=W2S1M7_CYPE1|nr:uncharacterized protein HMPREF1541_01788 [Cyphellophora europaea CBS 101466]ETN42631.1 hypothetical protein HMPREF1541_01788 [Cyphellophora europaea CBS 101466]